MIARLERVAVFTLVALALAWALYWIGHDRPTLAVFGAFTILIIHAPILAFEFAMLTRLNRGDPSPSARAGELLRAWWREVCDGVVVFAWRQPFRSLVEPDHLPVDAPGRRAVVLVHGFVCNRGLWNPWMRVLRARGVPFVAVTLEPAFGSIERYPQIIEAAVQQVTAATGLPPVLVGHSMGGLAIRAWLRANDDADSRIAAAVTIGTPHHGTWTARFGQGTNARQMRLQSRWLQGLAASESPARRAGFTCYWSHCDNVVFPASTGTLDGAGNRHLRGRAHIDLAYAPEVLADVLSRVVGLGENEHSPGSTTPASSVGSSRASQ